MVKGIKAHIKYKSGEMKTVCTSNVLAAFGIDPETYQYGSRLHQMDSVLRREGWAVRSRDSVCRVKTRPSVGAIRKSIVGAMKDPEGTQYLVFVEGHVLLLDSNGVTTVDTDPRKGDRRKAFAVRAVFPGERFMSKNSVVRKVVKGKFAVLYI